MLKNDARLFGEAIFEGLSIKFEQELANSTESALCSETHEASILEIIATAKAIEQRISKKRLIAILVAAALLLFVGCTAFVYRNQIGSFVEHIYEEYVNVELPDGGEDPITEIEHAYTLSYVPEGYVLTDEVIKSVMVRYIYENEAGEQIIFDQRPNSGISIGVDYSGENAEVLEYNGVEIYLRATDKKKHFVWSNEDYAIKLVCAKTLSQEEILKIINEIQ